MRAGPCIPGPGPVRPAAGLAGAAAGQGRAVAGLAGAAAGQGRAAAGLAEMDMSVRLFYYT